MKSTLVNCKNYFNEESLQELKDRLLRGEKVRIYIDCIGHTRNHYETINYEKALKEAFGDNLVMDRESSFDTIYYLKEV